MNELSRTFWHGTTTTALEAILEEGLVPSRSKVGYNCLTTAPEMAVYYGRLEAFLAGRMVGLNPAEQAVLVRIPEGMITDNMVVSEARSATLSCYGCDRPGRGKEDLLPIADDWRAMLRATDCIGVREVLRITRDMTQVVEVPFVEQYEQVKLFGREMKTGESPPEVRAWLDDMMAHA